MNRKAIIISAFIALSAFELFGILSAVLMGRMDNVPIDKMLRIGITLTIIVGLVGILLALLFAKIEKHIPTKSLYLKSLIFFVVINTSLTAFKGIEMFITIDFAISTLISILTSILFIWMYLKIDKTKSYENQPLQ